MTPYKLEVIIFTCTTSDEKMEVHTDSEAFHVMCVE